jgi:hypothetical protein
MKKLNLGCGFVTPENWINVDYGFGARFMKNGLFRLANRSLRVFDTNWNETIQIHNLESTFPWDDESIDIIYASHILEHFTKDSGTAFLKECCRVLKRMESSAFSSPIWSPSSKVTIPAIFRLMHF